MLPVTKPFLPPLEEYFEYLQGIWDRNCLTNQGPLVKELEAKLREHASLSTPVYCVANGALGIQLLIKAMGIRGEILTTPFSYVATTACPLWEGCRVRFTDIEPDYLTLDPRAVESAITSQTEAILATHVYGNPCDVEAFERIGNKYGIAVIYDAAHAFGVIYRGRSLLEWGNGSMVSTHATKVFHTVEGGYVTAKSQEVQGKLDWMRRFGHRGFESYHGIATNAKMSEFHAAMGLVNLKRAAQNSASRQRVVAWYRHHLFGQGEKSETSLRFAFTLREGTEWNTAYLPVIFPNEAQLLVAVERMNQREIFPRRYFWPSLDSVPELGVAGGLLPVTAAVSSRVLCLPLSTEMTEPDVVRVAEACLAPN